MQISADYMQGVSKYYKCTVATKTHALNTVKLKTLTSVIFIASGQRSQNNNLRQDCYEIQKRLKISLRTENKNDPLIAQ